MIATFAAFLAAAATGAALLLAPRAGEILPESSVRIAQLLVYAMYGAMGRAAGYRLPLIGLGAAVGVAIAAHQNHLFRHVLEDSQSMVLVHGLQSMGFHAIALLGVPIAAAQLVAWRHLDLPPGGRIRSVVSLFILTCPWFWTWYHLLVSPWLPFVPQLEGWPVVVIIAALACIDAAACGMLTGAACVGAAQTGVAVAVAVAWGGCAAQAWPRYIVWTQDFGSAVACVGQGLDLGLLPWCFWIAAMAGWYIARRRSDSRSPRPVSDTTRTAAT